MACSHLLKVVDGIGQGRLELSDLVLQEVFCHALKLTELVHKISVWKGLIMLYSQKQNNNTKQRMNCPKYI